MLKNRIEDDLKSFDSMFEESIESNIGDNLIVSENSADISGDMIDISDEKHVNTYNKRSEAPDINLFLGKNKTFEEKSLEEKMNDIYEEFKSDTTITLGNIKDIAFRTAAIKGRWCSRLMAERVRYRRLKESLDRLCEEIGKLVDKNNKSSSYLSARQNRESVINSDENVKKLKMEMMESKQLQDYLTLIYESIKDLGYIVKNSLDALNLERGI